MQFIVPIWFLILSNANAGRNDAISRFRRQQSRKALNEQKRYEKTLTPVEKALHKNLVHLIETEGAKAAEAALKLATDDDLKRIKPKLPKRHRLQSSKKKDGRPNPISKPFFIVQSCIDQYNL